MFSATFAILRLSIIQEWGTISYPFLQSTHVTAKFLCFLLQSARTILSMNNWSFVPLLFLLHPVCSRGKASFSTRTHTYHQLWSLSSVCKQVVDRIWVNSYQQHYLVRDLSDTARFFQLSFIQVWRPCCWSFHSCGQPFVHVMLSISWSSSLWRYQGQVPSNWRSSSTLLSQFQLLLQCPPV